MNQEQLDRIAELRWEKERNEKRTALKLKLSAIIDINSFHEYRCY